MKTHNERIADLEEAYTGLANEIDLVASMVPWAVHKALEGLMDARKINYAEKRIIWDAVAKEIRECLATTQRINRNLGHRLDQIDGWSRNRR